MNPEIIADEKTLESLYESPSNTSIVKETSILTPSYRTLIEASPFVVLATVGPDGLDCSPRGDTPGFVRVADERTILVPDRRGNNRLDSLRNIVRDPRLALLFFVPGVNETLRINGRAQISQDRSLRESFRVAGNAPRTVIIVSIQSVYFQCARALIRSHLWDPGSRAASGVVPTAGTMLAEASGDQQRGAEYDRTFPERIGMTLY